MDGAGEPLAGPDRLGGLRPDGGPGRFAGPGVLRGLRLVHDHRPNGAGAGFPHRQRGARPALLLDSEGDGPAARAAGPGSPTDLGAAGGPNPHRRVRRALQGFLTLTEGNAVEYARVEADIKALAQEFRIVELAYDRWNAGMLIQRLQEDGARVVPVGMGYASLSAPMKHLEELVLTGRL